MSLDPGDEKVFRGHTVYISSFDVMMDINRTSEASYIFAFRQWIIYKEKHYVLSRLLGNATINYGFRIRRDCLLDNSFTIAITITLK